MKFQKHKTITVGDNKIIISEKVTPKGKLRFISDNRKGMNGFIHECSETFENTLEIIAQLPSSSPLDGIPLCEEIGVEELAEYYGELVQGEINPCYNEKFKSHVENLSKIDFLAGYNLNKSDGVYNESDMRKAFSEGIAIGQDEEPITESESTVYLLGSHQEYDSDFNRLIKSLPQTIQLLCNDEGEPIMIDNSFKYKSPTN